MLDNIPEISGYKITEQLHNSKRTLVYRAVRISNSQPVVIKLLRQEYPTFNELVQFRNQYTITRNLNIPSIIKSYSLENYKNSYALVMEDFGGISLAKYIKTQSLNITQFLTIAILIANTLHQLHQKRIIHKDIKPANILINPITKEVKLIDFSIASLLPRETQQILNHNIIEGTLAYISPEQTGRMNRGIDYRSDFYSLGVTFFELLTGKLPFMSDDAMEIIHCHIAKNPPSVDSIKPKIPSVLSAIVTKLMAKNAEKRYQSALGLQYDLNICLQQLESTGKIVNFPLGEKDMSDRFLIPEKIYGRELEVKTLLQEFDRVAKGHSELILIAGFSGIGKTSIVNEIHKPIIRNRGYFIKGKFDQFNRNIPFSAFLQAFGNLISQLKSENDIKLQQWRTNILQALGVNAQVIIEVIPQLQEIIGQQPPVTELTGSAAQNRFNLLFSKFIQVFTTKEHPLVIFLDDLQWADLASLQLIQLLMSAESSGYLLLIGAYRNNEVDPAHPLMQKIDQIRKTGVNIQTITLDNLKINDINHLISDTLNCIPKLAQPLTNLIYSKTKGNPFFTTQLLKSLHEDGLIVFNPPFCDLKNNNQERIYSMNKEIQGGWECDIFKIQALTLRDDVVDFMALKLQKLAIETQNILKLAACIGNQFDLETLAIVYQKTVPETAADLWSALQEGLILPQSEVYKFFVAETQNLVVDNLLPKNELVTNNSQINYKFLHDRVQQAAYSLIPEAEKPIIHWQIGRSLLYSFSQETLAENIFAVVNQLNQGVAFCLDPMERETIIQLNLQAGCKAKESIAFASAINYFKSGIDLLTPDSWENQYELTFNLHRHLAEAKHLNGNFDLAEKLIKYIFEKAKSNIDRAELYNLLVVQYTLEGKYNQALETGKEGLRLLEIEIPPDDTLQLAIDAEFQTITECLGNRKIDSLLNLNPMTQADKKTAIKILLNLDPSTYSSGKWHLYMLVSLKGVSLSLHYGNAPESVKAYANYGLILGIVFNNYQTGYEFGVMAYKLSEIIPHQGQKCRASLLLSSWLHSWSKPIAGASQIALAGYQAGLESGELQFAGYNLFGRVNILYFKGKNLKQILKEINDWLPFVEKTQNQLAQETLWAVQIAVLNLLGEPSINPQIKSYFPQGVYHTYQAQTFYLLNQPEVAFHHIREAEKLVDAILGFVTAGEYHFYAPLIFMEYWTNIGNKPENIDWQIIENHLEKLKIWADSCAENFSHKYLLIQAEIARLTHDFINAMDNYDRAIALAKQNGYIQVEALANELAAKFYLEWGKEKFAQSYIIEAYYCYFRWGAQAKVKDLEKRYPHLLTTILQPKKQEITNQGAIATIEKVTSDSSGKNILLDFDSIMQAAQAISSEIELDKLLASLMQIVIKNAGAQNGSLILRQEEKWVLVAQATQEHTEIVDIPLDECDNLPVSWIYSVARSQNIGAYDNLSDCQKLLEDRYLMKHQPKSVLCTPIINQSKIIGILYLENNLTEGAFTSDRIKTIQLLTTQAAISLENARLYQKIEQYSHTLEAEVARKTEDLQQKTIDLEATLKNLQLTQAQLIQSAKMSSLGQMIAGIAHEINNPVTFIKGNLKHTENYIQDLLDLITLYQQEYPHSSGVIQDKIAEIDLEFLWKDIIKIIQSMKTGSDRISKIVISLRNFSRLDEANIKTVDLHSGIDSTLLILQKRLQANGKFPEIKVIKEYGNIPKIKCNAAELNQVFLNIITNAIDALQNIISETKQPVIKIKTELIAPNRVKITITDNGVGIPTDIQTKIFDPFFTTKPIGSNTGLGLAISYAIIKNHRGTLTCNSTVGKGTEFAIEIPI